MIWSCLHHFSCTLFQEPSGWIQVLQGMKCTRIWGALLRKRCKIMNTKLSIKCHFLKLEKKTLAESYYEHHKIQTTDITFLITFQHTCEIHSPRLPAFGCVLIISFCLWQRYCKEIFRRERSLRVPQHISSLLLMPVLEEAHGSHLHSPPRESTQWGANSTPKSHDWVGGPTLRR